MYPELICLRFADPRKGILLEWYARFVIWGIIMLIIGSQLPNNIALLKLPPRYVLSFRWFGRHTLILGRYWFPFTILACQY